MGGVGADVLRLPLCRFEERCYACISDHSCDEYFGNATMYLQLFQKNKENEIVPAQLRLAEMSTKKLSKKHKEEKSLELDNRMMSVHAKLPELTDSDWSKQSRKELQEALTDGKITEDDCNREIANLDEPIYGSGKTTDTKCVAQIGNYMVIDSELNGDCLYAAVIQSNDTIIKWGKESRRLRVLVPIPRFEAWLKHA